MQRELRFEPEIVGVEKRDQIAARVFQTGVARFAEPAILLKEILDALVAGDELLNDAASVVARPIVNNDQFTIGLSLSDDRPDGVGNVFAGVVSWHDDTDELSGHESGSANCRTRGFALEF